MPTVRKDPSRYARKHFLLIQHAYVAEGGVKVEHNSKLEAKERRMLLYAFRQSLRNHPEYNPTVLKQANSLTFSVEDRILHIKRKNGES